MGYDAFMSYSHAADGRLAPAVQTGLERLARPWYRVRALRVFRDDTGLSVNPHLWASIVAAMDDSSWFVLMVSPEAAASPWVNREIEHWCTANDPGRILPVLTEGALVWDGERGDYDVTASSALPPALAGRFVGEPRHLDLRWARDETQLDLRHARFREAIADLAAPLHGIPKEELESEDVRRQRRAVRLARAAVVTLAVLLLAATIAGGIAVRNAGRADRSAREARAQARDILSRQLATSSTSALDENQTDLALLLAVAAERTHSTVHARGTLLSAVLAQPRLRTYLRGLTGAAGAMSFSPDGTLLAVSERTRIRVWSVASGRLLARQPAGFDRDVVVTGMQFSPDGSRLMATVDDDVGSGNQHVIATWGLRDNQMRTIDVHRYVQAFALGPDARTLALSFGDMNSDVELWDLNRGTRLGSLPVVATQFAFSEDGSMLATGTRVYGGGPGATDGVVVRRWAMPAGTEVGTPLQGQSCACGGDLQQLGLSFSGDGKTVRSVVGGVDPLVITWDAVSGQEMSRHGRIAHGQDQLVAGVSDDETLVAMRNRNDGVTTIVDTTNGATIGDPIAVPSSLGMAVSPVAFSPDASQAAVGGTDGPIRLYDVRDPRVRLGRRLAIDASSLVTAAVAPDGRGLAVGRTDGTVDVVDLRAPRLPLRRLEGRLPELNALDFVDGGKRLIARSFSGMFMAWDVRSGRAVEPVRSGPPGCRSPAVASDGRILVFVCDTPRRHSVVVWDVARRRIRARWDPPAETDNYILDSWALSPDGRVLALGFRGSLRLVETFSGKPLHPEIDARAGSHLGSLLFSPDGSMLAVPVSGGIDVYMVSTGQRRSPLGEATSALAFSPDGSLLVSGSADGTVQLWDVATGTRFGRPFVGHGYNVTFAAFAQHGDRLLSATLSAPDVVARELLEWDLDESSWVAEACRIANRDLTQTEWRLYAGSTVGYRKACA
jgi:WD40 repeat protein